MLLGGDEFGRTQRGQQQRLVTRTADISWFDWNIGEAGRKLLAFAQRVDPAEA